jgi:hypothetical protein
MYRCLLPKTLSEFFQYAVHLVYAIVIGLSFDMAKEVVIPIEAITKFPELINLATLILGYFIVVTSWIGYFKSMQHKPHKENILGITRFGTDLFIVFLFYYFVSLTDPKQMYISDIFVYVLPSIYLVYLFWDIIKYNEYKSKKDTQEIVYRNRRRIKITVDYLVIFVIMAIVYVILMYYNINVLTPNNIPIRDIGYIIASFLFIGLYRHAKWNIEDIRKINKPRKRKNSKNNNS